MKEKNEEDEEEEEEKEEEEKEDWCQKSLTRCRQIKMRISNLEKVLTMWLNRDNNYWLT